MRTDEVFSGAISTLGEACIAYRVGALEIRSFTTLSPCSTYRDCDERAIRANAKGDQRRGFLYT